MVQRLRAANTPIWLAIIFLGCVGTLSQIIFDNDKAALLIAFLSVCGWTFWYIYSTWLFGMRRHVTQFMQRPIDRLTFVDKHVSTNRLADVVQAMQKHQQQHPDNSVWAMAAGSDLKSLRTNQPAIDEILWRTVDIDGGNLVNIPANAVFLLTVGDQRCVVKATFDPNAYDEEEEFSNHKTNPLQLCAHSIEAANALMQWLLKQSSEASIFRGHVLQVHNPNGNTSTKNFVSERSCSRAIKPTVMFCK